MPYYNELRLQVVQNIPKSTEVFILLHRQCFFNAIHTCMGKTHFREMLYIIIERKIIPISFLLLRFHTVLCPGYIEKEFLERLITHKTTKIAIEGFVSGIPQVIPCRIIHFTDCPLAYFVILSAVAVQNTVCIMLTHLLLTPVIDANYQSPSFSPFLGYPRIEKILRLFMPSPHTSFQQCIIEAR